MRQKVPIFKPLFMVGALMACITQASAQQLASSNRLERSSFMKAQPSQKSLKDFLQELEAEYSIRINYASEIVLGKMVNVPLDENKGIESKLKEVLTPLGLEYEQMQEDMYFIFQKQKLDKVVPQPLEGLQEDKKTGDTSRKIVGLKNGVGLQVKIMVQDNTITGKVSDENGEALPGVNVIIKDKNTGTTTDVDGQYRLSAAEEDVLIFSYIGYLTEEVPVGNRTVIDISLIPDIQSLGEVVVTALGIARESNSLPYSTQSVKPKELTEVRDANNVLNSLQGKIANALITQSSGGVGSEARVVLRGNSSIDGSNSALIVVDGVPNSRGVNINPDDIASITVLNGASAAALYGSQAGNGVIVIETKKGSRETISVDINSSLTFDRPFSLPEFQNEYGQGDNGVLNPASGNSWGEKMNGQEYTNVHGDTRTYSPEEDNVKDFFNTGTNLTNSLSISGGTEKAQGYLSYSNSQVKGIIPENDLKSHNINLRLTNQITSRLSTDAKITYYTADVDGMPRRGEGNTAVLDIYQIPRNMSLADAKIFEELDEFGVVTPAPWPSTLSYRYQNPYWVVNYDRIHEDRSQIFGFLSAKLEITDWLSVTGRANLDKSFIFGDQKTNQGTVSWATRPGGYFSDSKSINTIQWYDLIFKGNNDLGELFHVDYNLGAIFQDQKFTQDGTVSNGLNVANKFTHNFGTEPVVSSSGSQIQTQSVFGLVNLSYRDAIYLEASVRNDWDSRLPSPHSYQYYSVGGSGIISELVELPSFISLLKANLSYAEVGNGGQFGLLKNTYQYSAGVANGYISRTSTFSIPGLKPEIIKSKEVGLEAKFFNNRYSFNFTYYRSNSINQLLTISLPEATGYQQRYINAGDIQNSGVELILSASPIIQRDFDWLIDFNIAFNRNKVLELADGLDVVYQGSYIDWGGRPQIAVGGSYGDLVATKWARDENGNFLVSDTGVPITSGAIGEQPSVIGNFNPKATLGLTNTFTYKNFSLRVLTDGRIGGVVISGTEQNLAFSGITESTLPYREGGWVLGGVNTNGEPVDAAITAQEFWQTASQKRSGTGEFFTYNATNFRVREVSIGYSVPLASSKFIKSVRLSVVGRNLLWLYRGKSVLDIPGLEKRKMWLDPDVSLGYLNSFQGIEYGMPSTRSVGFNLNLSF